MAVGDKVVSAKNIRTVDPKTGDVMVKGIPKGMVGTVIEEDVSEKYGSTISVEFENYEVASFGDSLVDGLDSIMKNPKVRMLIVM